MYITQMEPELKIEHSHVPVKIEELPKRVKATSVNSSSKTVKVISNYFPVKIKPFKNIYIFKVIFEPYILHDNRKLRLELLKEALPLMKQQIKNPVIGGMNIYSVSEPEKAETQYLVRQYKISVKLVKNFNVFENPKIMLHFLNNGIRNIMNSLNYIEIGKTGKYFNMSKPNQLNDNLYLYPGHKANFLLAQAGLFLRVDPVNKIVQKKTVLQYIDNLYKSSNSKERQQKRQLVKQALINKIVMTNYGKPRYVKIEDIQFEPLSDVWVDIAHGKSVERLNILDYYMKKYNINVRKSSQPLLVIENKKSKPNQNFQKILMLPELCLMTGLPQDIDEFKRRDISKITIVGPQAKFKSIQEVMRQIKSNQEQNSLAELGIQISSQASKIVAQVIPSPELKLAEKQRVQKGKQSFFNLTSQKLYYSGNKMKVAIIHVQSTSIGSMLDTFQATASKLGLVFDYKVFKIAQKGGRDFELKNNIFQLIERAREMEFNCCIIVLKNSMKNCYQDLKRRCLQEFQIITQIVVEGTLKKKGEKSIHTKILLQIAAKMGNILWQPSIPAIFKERSSMILSFNYSKAGCSKKLVGVGSSDKYFSSYFSESSNLNNNADKFKQMVSIVFKLLNRFIKRNNHLPKQLIILTDSCPKDEIKMLYEHFIPLYNAKMSEISQTNDTKMTIIHATDICNERFFSQRDIGGLDNPTPGLLVSNTIVSENYDFYLVSQKANRGCTVPIHFKVVYSNSALQENVIHELMYSQCFNYFNWTGSIKVPAVMQYAKKFARFCSENLKQNIENDNLVKRLYYI